LPLNLLKRSRQEVIAQQNLIGLSLYFTRLPG
jgi:hypothetical protein